MTQSMIDKAFDIYGSTVDPRERQKALSDLMTLKAVPKQAADPRFEEGLARWRSLVVDESATAEYRLLAIAELIRAGQMVKKLQTQITKAIEPAFACPLSPLSVLKDADDRLNVARACSLIKADWLLVYLAQSIAEEDTGEKARVELIVALMARVNSVSHALALLAQAFSAVRFETEAPGDSMAKRLIRTLSAFRPALLTSLVEAGEDAGKQLDGLVRDALRKSGRPQEEKVQIDLTREVALTLHDLVRTRFSVSTEAETFAALKFCRVFFLSASWPMDLRQTMELLVQDVSEALVMLGRQDVPNQGLLEQLELACGLKERARVVATNLANKHSELPERIRDWLKRGRLVPTISASEMLEESLLQAVDSSIGLALYESRRLKELDDSLHRIISTLEIYDPALAITTKGYEEQVAATLLAIVEVAKRRGIDLLGALGEEVEFTPKYFDPLGSVMGRKVIVRRPAIVRSSSLGSPTVVVLKGLVD